MFGVQTTCLVFSLFWALLPLDEAAVPSSIFELPAIKFADLLSSDVSSAVFVANQLISLGAVQITDIPQFSSARTDALGTLASCLQIHESKGNNDDKGGGIASSRMLDGSTRRTIATARRAGRLMPMSNQQCGQSATKLRAIVDSTLQQFCRLLDSSSATVQNSDSPVKPLLMSPSFSAFEDIARQGEHLEHLHAYYGNGDAPRKDSDTLIPLHTDSGIFVAMTSGLVKTLAADEEDMEVDNELHLQLPSGTVSRVVADKDALIIFAGEGAAQWLSPAVLGHPVRAVPHALLGGSAGGESGRTRAWFGLMVLPPAEALVPLGGGLSAQERAADVALPYREYRARELNAARRVSSDSGSGRDSDSNDVREEHFPVACNTGLLSLTRSTDHGEDVAMALAESGGSDPARRMLSNSLCTRTDGSSGVMCWTICQAVTDLPCGTNAICTDLATKKAVDGGHCTSAWGSASCQLTCPTSSSGGDNSEDASENGGDTKASTEVGDSSFCRGSGYDMYMGGFVSALGATETLDCLLLFSADWKLDSGVKFTAACIFIFGLGVFIEFLSSLRRSVFKKKWSRKREVSLVCLHGLQVMLAYLLMLAAMTYSAEMFAMVILGLTAGYAFFSLSLPPPASTEPCCKDLADLDMIDMSVRDRRDDNLQQHHIHNMPGGGPSGRGVNAGEYQKVI